MKCVKVNIKDAEKVRKMLIQENLLLKEYRVIKDKDYVYFPVKSVKDLEDLEIIDREFELRKRRESLKGLLKGKLTEEEFEKLKTSFDVVGDIAILEIDKGLESKEKEIADALLKSNKNIKTVLRKVGGHKGEYRIQKYKFLKGEDKRETLYKENNVKVKLNVEEVYFSPRLSSERLRIASLVKENEKVLVMFSGVGIYPLVIARNSDVRDVYGAEINPKACEYAEENRKLNDLFDLKLYCGDVRDIVPKLNIKFDRIVMPLPKDAENFLDVALDVSKKGAVIHLYAFREEDKIEDIWKDIKERIGEFEKISIVKCGQIAPKTFRICAEFKVK